MCGWMIEHLEREYDFRKCNHHFAHFQATHISTFNALSSKWKSMEQQQQFSFLDHFKMKSKTHLYRNTFNTVRSSWAMRSCEWAILSTSGAVTILCIATDRPLDTAMATATNDPYVRGNYRKCAYFVWKLANAGVSMYVRKMVRMPVVLQIAFSFVYLHTFSQYIGR